MVARTTWLANESPPWAVYRAIIAAWLVALDKCPRVRPVGSREVCRRLSCQARPPSRRDAANEAYRSVNLCAGLKAGIEGAIKAVREQGELGRGETETKQRENSSQRNRTAQERNCNINGIEDDRGENWQRYQRRRRRKKKPICQRWRNSRTRQRSSVVVHRG